MSRFVKWLDQHVGTVQALTAILSVFVAIGALIAIKVQINESERLQREQSARDIYREYLNLSINQPDLADPDYCAIKGSDKEGRYQNYVEYMLYTAEQTIDSDPAWTPTMLAALAPHSQYLCSAGDIGGDTPGVKSLVTSFRAKNCDKPEPCGGAAGQK